jgi:hypothetical protein
LKTSFTSRLALLFSFIALVAGLASPAAGQTLPNITSVTRVSSEAIYLQNFITYSVAYTPGSDPVTSITITITDNSISPFARTMTVNNPGTPALVSVAADSAGFSGSSHYIVARISLRDSSGRTTDYYRNGERSSVPAVAGSPTSHSFNFAGLDFYILGDSGLNVPRLTALTRTSADPLTRGAPVTFTVAYELGSYDVTQLAVEIKDSLGGIHQLVLAGNPVVGGNVSLATDASWPDGTYTVTAVRFVDTSIPRTVTFSSDGSVSVTPSFSYAPTAHSVGFASQDFRVTSPAGTAPILGVPPAPQSVFAGNSATFSVQASGSATLTYQWSRNGTPIADGTEATLTLNDVQETDAGNYSVTVRNSAGAVTTANALLTVFPLTPMFVVQPGNAGGDEGGYFSATFEVRAPQLSALSWRANIGGRTVIGVLTSSLITEPNRMTVTVSFGPLKATDTGTYQVIAINPAGTTSSEPHRLAIATVIPAIVTQPMSQTAAASSRLTLSVEAVALGTLLYQWKKDDVAISGATNDSLSFASVQPSDAGRYTVTVANIVTSVTSDVATLTVVTPPTITTQPANQSAIAGDNVNFTVAASGTAPFTYQWFKGSTAISGATAATLALRSVVVADGGSYSVGVTNVAGTVRSSAATLSVGSGAPAITAGPVGQTATAGGNVNFSVTATGAGSLSYQWYRNSTALTGETRTTLALTGVTSAQAGDYSVTVTNSVATARSSTATLIVVTPNPARLINLSVLTSLGAGDNFTVGFVIGGSGTNGTKPLLIRAVGPTLASAFGVLGAHADPKLEVLSGATKIGENDNWIDDPSRGAQFAAVGAFAFAGTTSKDAALYVPSLSAGNTSVRVSGVGSASGAVLAELYETTPSSEVSLSTPRLINVSVLKNIGSGLTAGFVIGGTGAKTILVRAVGPGLAGFGVADFVADPSISLFNSASVKLGSNDNWDSKDAAIMSGVGAFALPAGSKDAAYVATALTPGSYTVQVIGATPAGGTALVEIYEVP